MAASVLFSKFLLFVAMIVFLTFVSSGLESSVEDECTEGPCLDEILIRSKRASAKSTDLTNSARDALMACKLLIKELVIPLDPVKLESTVYSDVIEAGNYIKANFSNVTLYGISTLRIQSLVADSSKLRLGFKLNFTDWNVTGSYNLTARFSAPRPVHGNDTFVIMASEVRLGGNSSLKMHSNGSLTLGNLKLGLEYGKGKVTFYKLDKDGSSKEAVNRLLIALARHVLEQATPKLLLQLKAALETCLNNKLASVNVFKG